MKKQGKLIIGIMLFAMLCTLSTLTYGQVRFGLRAGLNLSNASIQEKESYYETDGKPIGRLHFGGIVEYSSAENVTFQSGLIFMGKGSKVVETFKYGNEEEELDQEKYTPLYLNIPMNVLYQNDQFFFGGGPYIGFGIGGSRQYGGISSKLSYGSSGLDDWALFDLGLGVQLGFKLRYGNVGAGYDLGLTSIYPKGYEVSNKPKNRVFNIFAAYMFNTK